MKVFTSSFYRLLFVFATILIFNLNSSGQVPSWIWGASADGDENYPFSTATDASGNIYVVGSYTGAMNIGGNSFSTNTYDMYIAKYDASGNVLWAQTSINSSDYNEAYGLAIDGSGNVYVAGYFYSATLMFGSETITNLSGGNTADVFLVKYDANGTALWATNLGNAQEDVIGYDVAADNAGNAYVAALYSGPWLAVGTDTAYNAAPTGTSDIALIKYDAAGNAVWIEGTGGAEDDIVYSVATDALGNVFITGWFNSTSITFGSTTLNNQSVTYSNVFVTKYNSSGTVLWARAGGGADNDQASDIVTDETGNCYVTGGYVSTTATFGSVTLTNVSAGGVQDVFLLKYDASGTLLWARTAGTADDESASSVDVDHGGGVYITGLFGGATFTVGGTTINNTVASTADIFVAKYSTSGSPQWAVGAGGVDDEVAYCITADASGNIYVCGVFTSSSLVFGPSTLTNTTLQLPNSFLARLGSSVDVNNEGLANSISVYPNPVTELVTVQLPVSEAEIKITDMTGREVFSKSTQGKKEIKINAFAFSKGIYFLEMNDGKKVYREKIVKQ